MSTAIPPINLQRLSAGWLTNPSYFTRLWNVTMQVIEAAVNAINDVFNDAAAAQTAADNAQTSANGAQTSAETAQTTATNALILADNSVQMDDTPAWAAPTGTDARTALASYSSPTISNPPTTAEVQAISDYLQVLSQAACAVITDLRFNHALHN